MTKGRAGASAVKLRANTNARMAMREYLSPKMKTKTERKPLDSCNAQGGVSCSSHPVAQDHPSLIAQAHVAGNDRLRKAVERWGGGAEWGTERSKWGFRLRNGLENGQAHFDDLSQQAGAE